MFEVTQIESYFVLCQLYDAGLRLLQEAGNPRTSAMAHLREHDGRLQEGEHCGEQ